MKVDEINKTKNIGISFLNIYLSIIFMYTFYVVVFLLNITKQLYKKDI